MKTPEARQEMVRQLVVSKIHWGARDQEVLDWLENDHGITGQEAAALLANGYLAKRKSVRAKALVGLVFSGIGVLFAGVFFGFQLWGHFFVIGFGSAMILVLGVVSLGVFVRSLAQLLTGHVAGSVD